MHYNQLIYIHISYIFSLFFRRVGSGSKRWRWSQLQRVASTQLSNFWLPIRELAAGTTCQWILNLHTPRRQAETDVWVRNKRKWIFDWVHNNMWNAFYRPKQEQYTKWNNTTQWVEFSRVYFIIFLHERKKYIRPPPKREHFNLERKVAIYLLVRPSRKSIYFITKCIGFGGSHSFDSHSAGYYPPSDGYFGYPLYGVYLANLLASLMANKLQTQWRWKIIASFIRLGTMKKVRPPLAWLFLHL